jgi:hypothetical protein
MTQKNIKTKGVIKMKKIGIAVFALMFVGVAYVGAEDVKVDFDGKSDIQDVKKSEGFTMPEAFSSIEYAVTAPKREVGDEKALLADNKSEVKPKALFSSISGLNPYQKIKFLESLVFNSKGQVASFYGKDIQDVLGKDRYEMATNTLFGSKSKKENKSQNDLKKSFQGFNELADLTKGNSCENVKDSWCVSQGTCGPANLGYTCSPCNCKD